MKKQLLISLLIFGFTQCKPTIVNKSLVTLENTHWKLSEMNANPIITPEGDQDVHFILMTEGGQRIIKGFGGCNSIMGSFTLSGTNIKFNVASTKMMCPAEQMAIEDFLTTVLTSTDSYKLDSDVLSLFEGDTSLADFRAMKP